jgi:hypothetical protein
MGSMMTNNPPWLLFMFSLSAKRASQRVDIWRRLRQHGSVALRSSGYVLPYSAANEERLQWLAQEVRKHGGKATIVQAQGFAGLPSNELARMFMDQRSKEYSLLVKELDRAGKKGPLSRGQLSRLRRRLQAIIDRDYFGSPQRAKVEALLARADQPERGPTARIVRRRKEFRQRTWVTRHRPGIDRVASAWLIRRFIDPQAVFVFANDPKEEPSAVPFDMFSEQGFGHRGDDCTFESLAKDFALDDLRVKTIGQTVHDADLGDEKYGRIEAVGLDRVLIGWAHQGLSDQELLLRGMDLIEGLYQAI